MKKIILLEDDSVYGEVIGYYLEEAFKKNYNFRCLTCKENFEKELKDSDNISLVVSDIVIPKKNADEISLENNLPEKSIGFNAIKMIPKKIPVIVLSVLGLEVIDELKDLTGRKDLVFFRKPFDTDRLIEKIKEMGI